MKRNIGTNDRVLRLLMASLIAILHFTHAISGNVATSLIAVAIMFVLTGLLSICPVYSILGINTCERSEQES